MKKKTKLEKRIDAEMIAERVKLLWGFLADFIPHKEMLKDTAELAGERHSTALAMAPIFGAFGQDWEEKDIQTRVRKRRADALYNLVNVLDETEQIMANYAKKKAEKQAGLAQLHRALGL